MDTMETFDSKDFLTPGGLSLFSVALPWKTEKIVMKNLPTTINHSDVTKKNHKKEAADVRINLGG